MTKTRPQKGNKRAINIIDTLKNPVKYGKIRTDMSQQVKGETCTVIINVETGKLVTIYGKKTQKE